MTGVRLKTRERDPGAEALKDPLTTIQPADTTGPQGRVEYATTERAADGSTTVNVGIVGNNTLHSAGVSLSYGEDGSVNARQIPHDGMAALEINIAGDGTTMPAVYHGKYGPELIG